MAPNSKPKGKSTGKVGSGRLPAAAKLWSWRAENIVRAGIFAVNIYGASKALDTARSMKGDADAVIAVANKWREAAVKLNYCENPLFMSHNSLTADWSGPAYSAFKELMIRNSTVATGNATALLSAETALLDLSIQVTNTYNAAVDLTTLAASRIEPALGGLGLTNNKPDDKPTITKALIEFVAAINEQDTKLRAAINSQKVGLAKFTSALANLKSPGEVSGNIENPRRWKYH